MREDKGGAVPDNIPPILERLNVDPAEWIRLLGIGVPRRLFKLSPVVFRFKTWRQPMGLDGIFAVVGVFVAVYAILPRVNRIQLHLAFGYLGWLVTVATFLLAVAIQFYDVFQALDLVGEWPLAEINISPGKASFLIVMASGLLLFSYVRTRRLSTGDLERFHEVVLELRWEKKYLELFSIFESSLYRLDSLYRRRTLYTRFYDWAEMPGSRAFALTEAIKKATGERVRKKSWIRQAGRRIKEAVLTTISSVIPSLSKSSSKAGAILDEVISNEKTIKAMAEFRPYLALNVLRLPLDKKYHFFDRYMRSLIKLEFGALYHEMMNNQNLSGIYEYSLPENNRLLHFLFYDCEVAEKLGAWQPIGEVVIETLDDLSHSGTTDENNRPPLEGDENAIWRSPIFIGIQFFDIMVTSALHQGIKWHMWLYYYPHFATRIIRNIDMEAYSVDATEEWPTTYHRFLYDIVHNLCNWIRSIEYVELKEKGITLESSEPTHENGNILKSSILAAGQILFAVLTSEKIHREFKRYLSDVVFRAYFDLKRIDDASEYSLVFLKTVIAGGPRGMNSDGNYLADLEECFQSFDKIPYDDDHVDEVEQAIRTG